MRLFELLLEVKLPKALAAGILGAAPPKAKGAVLNAGDGAGAGAGVAPNNGALPSTPAPAPKGVLAGAGLEAPKPPKAAGATRAGAAPNSPPEALGAGAAAAVDPNRPPPEVVGAAAKGLFAVLPPNGLTGGADDVALNGPVFVGTAADDAAPNICPLGVATNEPPKGAELIIGAAVLLVPIISMLPGLAISVALALDPNAKPLVLPD